MAISCIVLIWAGLSFYHYIDRAYASELAKAKQIALSKSVLVQIDKVKQFSGEESFFVFKGIDVLKQPVWVWVDLNGETYTQFANPELDIPQIEQKVKKMNPKVDILRVVPGKIDQAWAWEVLSQDQQSGRLVYFYFNFQTGELLKTYRLTKTRDS